MTFLIMDMGATASFAFPNINPCSQQKTLSCVA